MTAAAATIRGAAPGADRAVFDPCPSAQAYAAAVAAWTPGAPVPVLVAGRPDLADASARAAALYEPAPAGPRAGLTAALVEPADGWSVPVAAMVARLAGRSVPASDLEAVTGDVVLVGRYGDLDEPLLQRARAAAARSGSALAVLTGRDEASLSWLVAKQCVTPAGHLDAAAVYSGSENVTGSGAVDVTGRKEIDDRPVAAQLRSGTWRTLVLHGHGTEDSINLGMHTVCGLNAGVPHTDPTRLRPKCGYGLGCYKDEAGRVPLHAIAAAEVVLASCCNATVAPNRLYDERYLLLLDGVDGVARDLLVSPVAHDTDAGDLHRWIAGWTPGGPAVPPAALGDVHPFPAYLRIGLPSPHDRAPAAADPPVADLVELANRVTGLAHSGLLPGGHRFLRPLTALAGKLDAGLRRAARRDPSAVAALRTAAAADVQSLDLRIAAVLARDPEDPLLDFPAHFGDRSGVDPATVRRTRCLCGLDATAWRRTSALRLVPDTTALQCPRCGDVLFATEGAPDVGMDVADAVEVGEDLRITVTVTAARRRTVHAGVFVPGYLRAFYPTPGPARATAGPDGTTLTFTLPAAAEPTPQAYYVTAYVVSELTLTTARRRFGVHPRGGTR